MNASDPHERPWGRPNPAVARTRVAVRRALSRFEPGGPTPQRSEPQAGAAAAAGPAAPLLLVALSGGADSLALAAAAAYEAPRSGYRVGAVVVDHGLQADSAQVAEGAAAQARRLGLAPVLVRRVVVAGAGDGPEAAARSARYAALESAREEAAAVAVLTAHTRDDQAEQVLLALARGSGSRALAGIPHTRGAILRPFLALDRATTEHACAAQRLEFWQDPHNRDPAFARVRARRRVLPVLERELGPGVAANLARSAELAREDADALDALAAELLDRAGGMAAEGGPQATNEDAGSGPDDVIALDASVLAASPPAIRHRAIRAAAGRLGSVLTREHTLAVAALVTEWRGQGPIDLPGLTASRSGARVLLRPKTPEIAPTKALK